MKTIFFAFFSLLLTGLAAQPGNFDPEMMVQRQTDRMAEALELDEATKAKVYAINKEAMDQMIAARQEAQGDREAMMAVRETVNMERDEKLKVLFTYDQWTKYETWKAEREANRPQGQGKKPGGKKGNKKPQENSEGDSRD